MIITNKGTIGKFELRTIDPRIVSVLINLITDDTVETIYIHEHPRKIISIQYNKVPFICQDLLPAGSSFRLRFKSPVIFANSKRKNNTDPYPKLERIWGDLIKKYELFTSPIEKKMKTDLLERLSFQLATPNFDIRSAKMTLGKNMTLTGFVGSILFVIEDDEKLEIVPDLLNIAENWGVGGKLALGFGLVKIKIRTIEKKEDKNNKDSKTQ